MSMHVPKPPTGPFIWNPQKRVLGEGWSAGGFNNYVPVKLGEATLTIRQQDFYRPATKRTPKSASGWRNPLPWGGNYEIWTPSMPGFTQIGFIGEPRKWESSSNSYNTSSGKISLTFPPLSMRDRAVVKALAKLKQQKVNLSVAFGERREAAMMMANTVNNIAKSIRKFKGKNPLAWAKVLKKQTGHGQWRNIPNSWLELQYGWKPLMSDVYGAVEALNTKERDGDAYRATVKAVVKEKFHRTARVIGPLYMVADVPLSGEFGYQVRLDYVLENPLLATLAQLGITNPAELAWELVPYSFVIDWFSPIGSYLASLDAALGWAFKGGSNTAFTRQEGSAVAVLNPSRKPYNTVLSQSAAYMCNQMSFSREVYTSSPLPRFPGIKNPLSTGHVANAMSLLVSAFR